MIINWKTKYFVLCNIASPGKRQCVREDEINIKPDTPAISSVRSRMHKISQQRDDWSPQGKFSLVLQ